MNEVGSASRRTIIRETDDATTVTVGEMKVAVAAIVLEMTEGETAEGARTMAEDVLVYVIQHREREWRAGDVVRDASNHVWQRMSSFQWRRMGMTGMFSHSRPLRPLTLISSPKDEADERRALRGLERARDEGMEA